MMEAQRGGGHCSRWGQDLDFTQELSEFGARAHLASLLAPGQLGISNSVHSRNSFAFPVPFFVYQQFVEQFLYIIYHREFNKNKSTIPAFRELYFYYTISSSVRNKTYLMNPHLRQEGEICDLSHSPVC